MTHCSDVIWNLILSMQYFSLQVWWWVDMFGAPWQIDQDGGQCWCGHCCWMVQEACCLLFLRLSGSSYWCVLLVALGMLPNIVEIHCFCVLHIYCRGMLLFCNVCVLSVFAFVLVCCFVVYAFYVFVVYNCIVMLLYVYCVYCLQLYRYVVL